MFQPDGRLANHLRIGPSNEFQCARAWHFFFGKIAGFDCLFQESFDLVNSPLETERRSTSIEAVCEIELTDLPPLMRPMLNVVVGFRNRVRGKPSYDST